MLLSIREFYTSHKEKILYLLVGGWNTAFGYLIYVGLYYLFHGKIHYTIILVISYMISITNNYIGYKLVVFKSKGNIWREYFRFYIVYGIALIFNILALSLLVDKLGWNMYFSQFLVTLATIVGSYFSHRKFSFRS